MEQVEAMYGAVCRATSQAVLKSCYKPNSTNRNRVTVVYFSSSLVFRPEYHSTI